MNNFYFNGYYSNEMGLIVEEKSIWGGLPPDFELISVPGRDSDIILDHNRYKSPVLHGKHPQPDYPGR